MSSIKCKNCNLINFSSEPHCKKCKQPLNGFSNSTNLTQNQTNSVQAYLSPPPPAFYTDEYQPAPPMSCIKCGGRNKVSLQNFKKVYIPPVSYLGFFMGVLPGLLLVLILKVKHYLSAPFCGDCWHHFSRVSGRESIGLLGCLGGFVGGLFALVLFESLLIMFIFFGFGVLLLIRGQLYKNKHSPKYKKVTRNEIIISDPNTGDISFAR